MTFTGVRAPSAGFSETNSSDKMLVVAIATTGRPEILSQTVRAILAQSRKANSILICPAVDGDVDESTSQMDPTVSIVRGSPGLPAQRNALLRASDDAAIVAFFDDDFLPETTYLEELEGLFCHNPDIAMSTGCVLADGILGPGLTVAQAYDCLEKAGEKTPELLEEVYNGYGCNMAVRMAPVRANSLEFDEALPLYGWLEDVDFSRRLKPHGRIVRSNRLRGVHLGNKGGRTKGVRLGYSQVVNPLYMVRKGTFTPTRAYRQIARNVAANAAKAFRPEPWVDRRGRFVGNLHGLRDAICGRLDPIRVLQL